MLRKLPSQKDKLIIHDPIKDDVIKCTVGLENSQYSKDLFPLNTVGTRQCYTTTQ